MTTHAKEPGATPARRAADIIIFQCNGIAIERIIQDAIDLELAALRATAEQLARALDINLDVSRDALTGQDKEDASYVYIKQRIVIGEAALTIARELKLLP